VRTARPSSCVGFTTLRMRDELQKARFRTAGHGASPASGAGDHGAGWTRSPLWNDASCRSQPTSSAADKQRLTCSRESHLCWRCPPKTSAACEVEVARALPVIGVDALLFAASAVVVAAQGVGFSTEAFLRAPLAGC
jgi:hypothetical protein